MNKLSKEKKDKLIMICLGTGGLLALLNFFLIGAQQDALAVYDRKISEKKDKVAKATQMLTMAPRIQASLEANRKVLRAEEEKMAPADQYRWLVELVPSFMSTRQITFEECTPKPRIEGATLLPKFSEYKVAIFGVKASGRYRDFGKFLADFENEFPYISVESVKMHPERARTPSGRGALDSALRTPAETQAEVGESSERLLFEMKLVTLIRP